uniref:DDE Tnp4 domain-containing protein n=1 Tax=Nothobranchius furzeri TaxID=105023 RepID=A0A8C6L5G9_NOTFU
NHLSDLNTRDLRGQPKVPRLCFLTGRRAPRAGREEGDQEGGPEESGGPAQDFHVLAIQSEINAEIGACFCSLMCIIVVAEAHVSRRRTIALLLLLDLVNQRKRSGFWVHPLNQQRRSQGDFYHLVAELRLDSQRHHQYFRMSAEQMDELMSLDGPELRRQSTSFRAAIEPKQRLAVGISYHLGHTTVRNSVHMVCAAIEKTVAQGIWEKWDFPNCLGALDGKHIHIQAPPRSGSQYFNYKKTFSIVLLALVDADYRFRVIQVGDFGRSSDGAVYAGSALGIGMERRTLHVPPHVPLPGAADATAVPHVMVGDAAFPLKPYLMRPYPGHNLTHRKIIFNYRLSRARIVVENDFGILASRWRIFYRQVNLHPDKVDSVVLAACILHNFLIAPSENQAILDEANQQTTHMAPVRDMGPNRASREACNIREIFCDFFISPEGSVAWQDRMV